MTNDPFQSGQWDGWVSDFAESRRFASLGPGVKEFAGPILGTFLEGVARRTDGELHEVDETALRATLLEDIAPLGLPNSARAELLSLLRAFLEELEEQGRLADGRQHGAYLMALHTAFDRAVRGPGTIENVASKLGRNDPCPCGSGRKYKKCCQGLLDD